MVYKHVFIFIPVNGEVGKVGLGIPANEVKDPVTAWIAPGRECGPRHRRLGRCGRGQPGKAAGLSQPCQIGQLAGLEQIGDDPRFQTIETDDDDLLDGSHIIYCTYDQY